MITLTQVSKSFLIPHSSKRSVKESLFSWARPVSYDRLGVLQKVSLRIEPGECVGIMGPNGSGKSTLLKIMAGVYQPDEGSVKVSGTTAAILELGVGFDAELSARENVMLNGLLLGIAPSQLRRNLLQIFTFADLLPFIDTPIKHYSSGMQARLAFATALQLRADHYLFDEVFAVGDEAFQKKCFQAIAQLREQGKTIVLVSHDQELIKRWCSRVVTLKPGPFKPI